MNKLFNGQSLFEVVVSLGIASLVLLAIVSLSTKSLSTTTFSKTDNLATRYAQEASEWLRAERDADWDKFYTERTANNPGKVWCLTELSWTSAGSCGAGPDDDIDNEDGLFREVTLKRIDPIDRTRIEATVEVSWTDSSGSHDVTSVTRFTDWRRL